MNDVERGETIKATHWKQMAQEVRATKLISGRGIRLTTTPNGTLINFAGSASGFNHPHKCTLQGDSVRILPGLINSIVGDDGSEPFTLDFAPEYDADGRAWIVAAVTFSDDWEVTAWKYKHTTEPFSGNAPGIGGLNTLDDGTVNIPIALIVKTLGATLHQHAFFNLGLRTRPSGAASGNARHLYFAT